MNIFGYIKESINEGDGLRSVLFVSGCHGMCEECHNPESWNFNYGSLFTSKVKERLIDDLVGNPLLVGLTYCGGEPFLHPLELTKLSREIKDKLPNFNFWSYSGYTFEEILEDEQKLEFLKELDVLIDGKFINSKKDLTLKFRGSSNQRVIDVQKSLKENRVILYLT